MQTSATTNPPPPNAPDPALNRAAAAVASQARFRASPRFYVTVGLLLASAATIQGTAAALKGYFTKLPVPLKKPLYQLSTSRLAPRYVLHRDQPKPLDEDMLQSLGTHDYLSWYLVDTTRTPEDPVYKPSIFLTYYTGAPDLVPHNPRECLMAAGWELVADRTISVDVPRGDGTTLRVPLAVLQFELPTKGGALAAQKPPRLVVIFFFYSNGGFQTTRTQVRLATQRLWDKYAYYSKFEITFSNDRQSALPTEEQAVEAVKPLLDQLLPACMDELFEDWEKLNAAPGAARG